MHGSNHITYPAAGINGRSNGPIPEIDELVDIVNISICTIREHGSASRESEMLPLVPNPFLVRLLNGELLVGHVRIPRQIPACRPLERYLVPMRRGHPALQLVPLLRAVPLPVYQPPAIEPQGPLWILTGRVLAVPCVAGRVQFDRGHVVRALLAVVGFKVERGGSVGMGCHDIHAPPSKVAGNSCRVGAAFPSIDDAAASWPRAEEVRGEEEADDEDPCV